MSGGQKATSRISLCNDRGVAATLSVSSASGGGRSELSAQGGGDMALTSVGGVLSLSGGGVPSLSNYNASLEFPPSAITVADNIAFSNLMYGNGQYLTTASSGLPSRYAFNKINFGSNISPAWTSSSSYTSLNGWAMSALVPSSYADAAANTYTGEWLQVQLPESINPTAYALAPYLKGASDSRPASFVLLGSADGGASWVTVDATYGSVSFPNPNVTISINLPSVWSTSSGFSTFRLVILRVTVSASPPSTTLPVTICQLQVFGQSQVSTVSMSRGATLITGRLGIGTAAPVQRLDVNGSAIVSGNVGIGVTVPAFALHVSRDSAAKPSSSTWTVYSDARIKDKIVAADLDRCYEIVRSIPLKRFAWRDDIYSDDQVNDRSRLGWIAQDVETVFPKAVQMQAMHGLDDCRTLNTDQLLSALYGAVQRMQQHVDKLRGQVSNDV